MVGMIEQRGLELAAILIVCDFVDMFPDEVPNLSPVRDVEFAIDFGLDMTLISKESYSMALLELK